MFRFADYCTDWSRGRGQADNASVSVVYWGHSEEVLGGSPEFHQSPGTHPRTENDSGERCRCKQWRYVTYVCVEWGGGCDGLGVRLAWKRKISIQPTLPSGARRFTLSYLCTIQDNSKCCQSIISAGTGEPIFELLRLSGGQEGRLWELFCAVISYELFLQVTGELGLACWFMHSFFLFLFVF